MLAVITTTESVHKFIGRTKTRLCGAHYAILMFSHLTTVQIYFIKFIISSIFPPFLNSFALPRGIASGKKIPSNIFGIYAPAVFTGLSSSSNRIIGHECGRSAACDASEILKLRDFSTSTFFLRVNGPVFRDYYLLAFAARVTYLLFFRYFAHFICL